MVPAITPTRSGTGKPATLCTSQTPKEPWMRTQSSKHPQLLSTQGRQGYVLQDPQDQSSPCASGPFREFLQWMEPHTTGLSQG